MTQLIDLPDSVLGAISDLVDDIGKLASLGDSRLLRKMCGGMSYLRIDMDHHRGSWNYYSGQLLRIRTLVIESSKSKLVERLPCPVVVWMNQLPLHELRMAYVESLPSEIYQLTNLQVLFLKSNKLTSLPQEIGQLTNLQMLFLHNNKLAKRPDLDTKCRVYM